MKDNLNLMKVGWNDWWWVYEMRWLLVERAHYSWSMNESNGVSETHAEPTWAAVALRSDEWSKQQSELAQQQSKKIENLFEGRPPKQHNHQSTQQSKDICFLLMIDWLSCLAGPYFHSINQTNSTPLPLCWNVWLIPFQSLHKLGYFNSTW